MGKSGRHKTNRLHFLRLQDHLGLPSDLFMEKLTVNLNFPFQTPLFTDIVKVTDITNPAIRAIDLGKILTDLNILFFSNTMIRDYILPAPTLINGGKNIFRQPGQASPFTTTLKQSSQFIR